MVKADQTLSLFPIGGVSETRWKPILLFWPCLVLDIDSTSKQRCQVAIEYISLELKGDAWVEEVNLGVINK